MENLEYKRYWVWFSLINDLNPIMKRKLLERYKNPKAIHDLNKNELETNDFINEKDICNIIDSKIKNQINSHLDYMQKNSVDIVNINDIEYPQDLKKIYDPPISLYIKGNKEILNNFKIAIIGSRMPTLYGINTAKKFAYDLSKKGIVIVSGLARGIDSYAHLGAVFARQKTIAVVGNGLNYTYPSENKILEQNIIHNNGCIISEYPLGTKPEKMNFPARNRIISGISRGVVVVEAKQKSGTLITVDFALEQGRDVFAVPGNIDSVNSVGTNDLINQGAIIATSSEKIFNSYLIK